MKLSVIIPVYNGADFVQKSYDSIINQQLDDFEIIYVDNNSVDASVVNIQELQQKDSKIKFFTEKKQGAASARNRGIENAKGHYIYMFDVDDQIYPGALVALIEVLDKHESIDAVFGRMKKSHKGIEHSKKPIDGTNPLVLKEKPYWGLKWFSDLKTVVGPPAFLYRKEVFNKIGRYDEALRTGEDTALDIKLGMLCNVAFIDKYIYLYLKHSTSTTEILKKHKDRAFMQWPRFVKSHLPFYLNNSVPMEFKKIFFKGIYNSFGRMLNLTEGVKNRKNLKKQLMQEIKPLQTPWPIKFYLDLLVYLNNSYIFKFYIYYLVPAIMSAIINKNEKLLK